MAAGMARQNEPIETRNSPNFPEVLEGAPGYSEMDFVGIVKWSGIWSRRPVRLGLGLGLGLGL